MLFRFNKLKLLENSGLDFTNDIDILEYMKELVYYLETHNKNLTKKQDFTIFDLQNILNSIEIKKEK